MHASKMAVILIWTCRLCCYIIFLKVKDGASLLFIDEIVTGCVRYKTLIKVGIIFPEGVYAHMTFQWPIGQVCMNS